MKGRKKASFDIESFLKSAGIGRRVKEFRKSEVIFSQGDPAVNVMYVRHDAVKLAVLSSSGKEAVVAVLGPGDIFGEWCLANHHVCIATATAIQPTSVLVIKKDEIVRVLHAQHTLCEPFVSYMVERTIRIEDTFTRQTL